MMEHKSIFCSWSGGKDCCLALDRFLRAHKDCKVYLLTMLSAETKKTFAHNLSAFSLKKQAEALGLKISFGYAGKDDYEEKWCSEIEKLKRDGVTAGVFGDIDVEEHYTWISRILTKLNLEMIMPLWKEQRHDVVKEFVKKEYQARIIAIKKDILATTYLGETISDALIQKMTAAGIDPSGESGEFHSLVLNGPIFKKKLALTKTAILESSEHYFINVDECLRFIGP